MATRITAVHFSETPKTHERIIKVMTDQGPHDVTTVIQVLELFPDSYYVEGGGWTARVGVVSPDLGQPYLRTYADGYYNDNLLSLPTF